MKSFVVSIIFLLIWHYFSVIFSLNDKEGIKVEAKELKLTRNSIELNYSGKDPQSPEELIRQLDTLSLRDSKNDFDDSKLDRLSKIIENKGIEGCFYRSSKLKKGSRGFPVSSLSINLKCEESIKVTIVHSPYLSMLKDIPLRPFSGSKVSGVEVFLNQSETGVIQKGFVATIDQEINLSIDANNQELFADLINLVKETK